MDGATVRMLLKSIVDGDPSQFDEPERREAVSWLKKRIYLTPNDKGPSSPQHQPHIESAASATEQALAQWGRGDKDAAKRSAEEALKNLSG